MLGLTIFVLFLASNTVQFQVPTESSNINAIESNDYTQVVTLTARPEVQEKTATNDKLSPPKFLVSSSNPNKIISQDDDKPKTQWFTRAELLSACMIPNCEDSQHCFGNPSSFLSDPTAVQPDGAHHEYCCAFKYLSDPMSDSSHLMESIKKCYSQINDSVVTSWCSGDESGISGPERCQSHGGVIVWNYSHGKIRLGEKKDGKCIGLDGAKDAFAEVKNALGSYGKNNLGFYGEDGNNKLLEPIPCNIENKESCCGVGKCVKSSTTGDYQCKFESAADEKKCKQLGDVAGYSYFSSADLDTLRRYREIITLIYNHEMAVLSTKKLSGEKFSAIKSTFDSIISQTKVALASLGDKYDQFSPPWLSNPNLFNVKSDGSQETQQLLQSQQQTQHQQGEIQLGQVMSLLSEWSTAFSDRVPEEN